MDLDKLQDLIDEISRWSIEIDMKTINFLATQKINTLLEKLLNDTDNLELLKTISEIMEMLLPLSLDLKLWEAQNLYFAIIESIGSDTSGSGHKQPTEWLEHFNKVGQFLQINNPL